MKSGIPSVLILILLTLILIFTEYMPMHAAGEDEAEAQDIQATETPAAEPVTPPPAPPTSTVTVKKTPEELAAELISRQEVLDVLTKQSKQSESQANTPPGLLRYEDVQKEIAVREAEAEAGTIPDAETSVSSSTGWISVIVFAGAGILLFAGLYRTMNRIIARNVRTDFIR